MLAPGFGMSGIASADPAQPLAPRWALHFVSDDLDEVREFVGRSAREHSRVVHGTGALGYRSARLQGATHQMGWSQVGIGKTIRGSVGDPVLHLCLPPGSVYRVGRHTYPATTAATAVFVPPDWDFSRYSPPGSLFGFGVDALVLEDELRARSPRTAVAASLCFRPMQLGDAERLSLFQAAGAIVRATGAGAAPGELPHANRALAGAVAGLLLARSALTRADTLQVERVRKLEAWIEGHLHSPVTLGRLCEVAGVGERSLQKAFESHRGMSPMRFVTERRLWAAYRSLRAADDSTTVTAVASELGFDHLGRFAALYGAMFGESPSLTMRRRRCLFDPKPWRSPVRTVSDLNWSNPLGPSFTCRTPTHP